MNKFTVAIMVVALALTACTASTTTRYYGGGGGGGTSYQPPNMDRLRTVDVGVGETVRVDTTPNNSGEQGTNAGHNSPDPDSFGKPGKISG